MRGPVEEGPCVGGVDVCGEVGDDVQVLVEGQTGDVEEVRDDGGETEMMKMDGMDMVPRMVEAKDTVRKMTTVLVEPGDDEAPTKRRRGKARRKLTNLGNIRNFFLKLEIPKDERPALPREGGAVMTMRKRKAEGMVEEHYRRPKGSKSRRTSLTETEKTVEMTNSTGYLGAKSFCGRGTTEDSRREATNWVESNLDDSGCIPGDLTKKTKFT